MPPDDQPTQPRQSALSGRLLQGATLMVAMRWVMRLLGLVNIAVLARLLAPADFGVVAMAMVAVGVADGILNIGIDRVVLQRGHGDHQYYSTAWTMRLCQNTLIALATAGLAPIAGQLYGDERVQTILLIIATGFFLRGFESIGVILLRQQLSFSREFLFNVAVQLISVPVTILLAFELRSYLALALGMMLKDIAQTLLSYAFAPYRPRLTLRGWQELWGMSRWLMVLSVLGALHSRVSTLMLGKIASPEAVGKFTVSAELALTPTSEIAAPVMRALFPGFVKLRDDLVRFRAAFLTAFEALMIIGSATCLGLSVVADELVWIALGARWMDAAPLVRLYAIGAVFRIAEIFLVEQVFVFGRVKIVAGVFAASTLVTVAATFPVYRAYGLEGVVGIYVVTQALAAFAFTVLTAKLIQTPVASLLRCLVRPTIAGLGMVAAVTLLEASIRLPHLPMLAAKVTVGALTFVALTAGIWTIQGRPPGLERQIWERVVRRIPALRGRP